MYHPSAYVARGEARVACKRAFDYLASDAGTLAILMQVESIQAPRKFMSAARVAAQVARLRQLQWPAASDVQSVTGKGVLAVVSSAKVSIGNLPLFADDVVPDAIGEQVVQRESPGNTTMLIRSDGVFLGLLGLADAPAMARATIGIAMGSVGADVALETADVALMADELSRLPIAIVLSRASHTVIQQNLWAASEIKKRTSR